MNIKIASEKLPRTPPKDVCTYKYLKNEFAKYIIPRPIKLYNILEIKIYLYLTFTIKKCEINKV